MPADVWGPSAMVRQPFAELDSMACEAGSHAHLALGSVHAPAAGARSGVTLGSGGQRLHPRQRANRRDGTLVVAWRRGVPRCRVGRVVSDATSASAVAAVPSSSMVQPVQPLDDGCPAGLHSNSLATAFTLYSEPFYILK